MPKSTKTTTSTTSYTTFLLTLKITRTKKKLFRIGGAHDGVPDRVFWSGTATFEINIQQSTGVTSWTGSKRVGTAMKL